MNVCVSSGYVCIKYVSYVMLIIYKLMEEKILFCFAFIAICYLFSYRIACQYFKYI